MSKCEDIIDAILDKDKTIADAIKPKGKKSNIDPAAQEDLQKDQDEPSFFRGLGQMAKDFAEKKAKEAVKAVTEPIIEAVDEVLEEVSNVAKKTKKIVDEVKKLGKKSTYKKLGKKAKEKIRKTAKATICNNSIVKTVSQTKNSIEQGVERVRNYSGKKKKEIQSRDPQAKEKIRNDIRADIKNNVAVNIDNQLVQQESQLITQPTSLVDIAETQSGSATNQSSLFDFGDIADLYDSLYKETITTCQAEMETFYTNFAEYNQVIDTIKTEYSQITNLSMFKTNYTSFKDRYIKGERLWRLNRAAILRLQAMNHSLYDAFASCPRSQYFYADEDLTKIYNSIIDYFPDTEKYDTPNAQVAPTVSLASRAEFVLDTKNDITSGDVSLHNFIKLFIKLHGETTLRTDLYPPLNSMSSFISDSIELHGDYWSIYHKYNINDQAWKVNTTENNTRRVNQWPRANMNYDDAAQPGDSDTFGIIWRFYADGVNN